MADDKPTLSPNETRVVREIMGKLKDLPRDLAMQALRAARDRCYTEPGKASSQDLARNLDGTIANALGAVLRGEAGIPGPAVRRVEKNPLIKWTRDSAVPLIGSAGEVRPPLLERAPGNVARAENAIQLAEEFDPEQVTRGVISSELGSRLNETEWTDEERAAITDMRRKQLEAVCASQFTLLDLGKFDCPMTLVAIDHGQTGSIAYKTVLTRTALAHTLESLADRFQAGKPFVVANDAPFEYPSEETLIRLLHQINAKITESVGIALIVGWGEHAWYGGTKTAERPVMGECFRELAGALREDARTDSSLAERMNKVVRDWQCPPGAIKTASQRELIAMNTAHAEAVLELGAHTGNRSEADDAAYLERIAQHGRTNPKFFQIVSRIEAEQLAEKEQAQNMSAFLKDWRASSFARLEVGHKLAAALCLTDVPPDIEVKAPWEAWSLVVPDGLLPAMSEGVEAVTISRVWLRGTSDEFLVSSDGRLHRKFDQPGASVPYQMLRNLILGACLALSNPDDFRKERQHKPPAAKSSKQRQGPPDLEQARFMLSAPVTVDFRAAIHELCAGTRKGTSPKVQFLVRGHWKNQVHGRARALRKRIFVQPFWKGPEEARVLLRQHKVEDGGGDE